MLNNCLPQLPLLLCPNQEFLKEKYHEQNKVTGERREKHTCHYLKVLKRLTFRIWEASTKHIHTHTHTHTKESSLIENK